MIIFFILFSVIIIFGFVVFFGAPYLPTMKSQCQTALDLLELKPGETLLELGSGDGRVVLAAAKRGYNVIGIELNPVLVVITKIKTYKYRKQAKIIWGNYWDRDLPKCDGIYVFLLDRYMRKLDKKIVSSKLGPVKLASYAFKIPGKKHLAEKQGVFLYQY
jgi:hypothetical protein